jgi:hypothetical protein
MNKTTTHCITLNNEDIDITVEWFGQKEHEAYEIGDTIENTLETFWEPMTITDDEGEYLFDWDTRAETDFDLACVKAFEDGLITI